MSRIAAGALAALLLAGSARAWQPPAASDPAPAVVDLGAAERQVAIKADRTKVGIGERIVLSFELPFEGTYREVALKLPADSEGLAVLSPVRPTEKGYTAELRLLQDGAVPIGPITITATPQDGDAVTFEAPAIRFDVAAPKAEQSQPRDHTQLEAIPYNWLWRNLIIGVAALAVAGALVLLLRWLLRRRAEIAALPPPPVPPIEEALGALGGLRRLETFRQHGPERHYTELSLVLRRYIERQYGANAMEMSEDEMVALVRDRFRRAPAASLPDLLQRASMAKYAREAISLALADADCGSAEAFLLDERRELEAQAARARDEAPAAPPDTPAAAGAAG